jgi:hypothetical protein
MNRTKLIAVATLIFCSASSQADAPVASYLFPAGGQRGKTVDVLVGGLNLNQSCNFEILGPGVSGPNVVKRVVSPTFEGPLLPLPDSQRQEDYPRTMAAQIKIAGTAPTGNRSVRLWTAQGVTTPLTFVVGDLPEIVEKEIEGQPIPMPFTLPATINGRIYPRENVDVWTVRLSKGQTVTCAVAAASIGSPLEAQLAVQGPSGKKVAEGRSGLRVDPWLRFTAAEDGEHQIRITDCRGDGGPAFVYRLTVTAGPMVDRIYPLGGRRGEKVRLQLFGYGVPAEPIDLTIPADAPAVWKTRWTDGNEFRLDVDDLPETVDSADSVLTAPFMGNGVVRKPGDVGRWRLKAEKGEAFDLELRADRLGSPLLGVVTVRDEAGKSLASAEAGAAGGTAVRFVAPAAGTYTVDVQDRFRSRGGPDFAYRLRVASGTPDFSLQPAASSLTIPRGGQATLRLNLTRRGNLTKPIFLSVDGLPAGVSLGRDPVIQPNQTSADLLFKADATARIESFALKVRGITLATPPTYLPYPLVLTRMATSGQAEDEIDIRAAVALPTPFKIAGDYLTQLVPRGTQYSRHFRIERNGFAGPIEVELADRQARHLQGVTGPVITVPADANEFDYEVQLPPWLETARTCRVCVMGTAIVKDADGSAHAVNYSSREQNDQIIAVIEPERLSIQLERTAIKVERGKEIEIAFTVSRGEGLNVRVAVEVQIPAHYRCMDAARMFIPADKTSGKLRLSFGADAVGPFNRPLVVRAVAMDGEKPVTAEAKIELLTGK